MQLYKNQQILLSGVAQREEHLGYLDKWNY